VTASPSARLEALGIVLPAPPQPIGRFTPAVRSGNLLFLSGLAPFSPDGKPIVGVVGRDFTTAEASELAWQVGLNLLAVIAAETGGLDAVRRVVKLTGFVNAAPGFTAHPQVIDGCSDLFDQLFGHLGPHARTSVGAGSLPNGIPVEIEAVVEVAG
jgi:enamine deaminase RidA (YjgF/YER057c/UK114 family)